MAILNFRITLNENEWKHLEETIASKNNGRRSHIRGKGFNNFIRNELLKAFMDLSIMDCEGMQINHIKKDFSLSIPDDTLAKINCLSTKFKITPAILISKMILDPHLSGKKISSL